jgi:uncharacterized Zn-binding protein involved in type VI secretion
MANNSSSGPLQGQVSVNAPSTPTLTGSATETVAPSGTDTSAFIGTPGIGTEAEAPSGLSGLADQGGLAGGAEDAAEDAAPTPGGGGGMPAARMGDMHACPMAPPPHVGGPVMVPCSPDVFTGGMPQARVTDLCICTGVGGPVDMIIMGSPCVYVNGLPAARVTDPTAHGGVIVMGCPNVFIGACGGGSPEQPASAMPGNCMADAADSGSSFVA